MDSAFAQLAKQMSDAAGDAQRRTSEQDQLRSAALAALDEIGKATVKDTDIQFVGSKFQLPERFAGDLRGAAKFLLDIDKQENQTYGFGRRFRYRWADGAAAFDRACMRVFGTTGLGQVTKGNIFSPDRPPMLRSVPISPTPTLQVPWGEVAIPALDATLNLSVERDNEFGILLALLVAAPRRIRRRLVVGAVKPRGRVGCGASLSRKDMGMNPHTARKLFGLSLLTTVLLLVTLGALAAALS